MFNFNHVSVSILWTFCCFVCVQSETGRLLQGDPAEAGEFPYMASVQVRGDKTEKWMHICGGTLVGTRHVVSTAHCYNSSIKTTQGDLSVLLGAHDLKDDKESMRQRIDVTDIQRHDKYASRPIAYDIVVLDLSHDAKLNERVNTITILGVDDYPIRSKCTAIGWGSDLPGGPTHQPLRKEVVFVRKLSSCLNITEPDNKERPVQDLGHTHLCGNDIPNAITFCRGDSGGPLVCPNQRITNEVNFVAMISKSEDPCDATNSTATQIYLRISHEDIRLFVIQHAESMRPPTDLVDPQITSKASPHFGLYFNFNMVLFCLPFYIMDNILNIAGR